MTVFDAVHEISLKDSLTAIAFKMEGYIDQEMKDDKRYLRTFAILKRDNDDGTSTRT